MYLSGIQTIIISKKTEQPCSAKNKKLKNRIKNKIAYGIRLKHIKMQITTEEAQVSSSEGKDSLLSSERQNQEIENIGY